jgi:hypothetical protein
MTHTDQGHLVALVMGHRAPVWGQSKAEEAADEQRRSDPSITLRELEGTEIEVKPVYQQVVQREGRQFAVTMNNELQVVVGHEGKIEQTWTPTAHTPRGTRRGETRRGSFILDQVREIQGLGSGKGMYQFKEGALIFLRTFREGAFRRTITFARSDEGFKCAATESFARQQGTGNIVLNSGIDGAPLTVVSWKPISSICHLTKR